MVSPRKSRRKSACFSRTSTSIPARASRYANIIPAGPPPAIQHVPRDVDIVDPPPRMDHRPSSLTVIGRKLPPGHGGDHLVRVCVDGSKLGPVVLDHKKG